MVESIKRVFYKLADSLKENAKDAEIAVRMGVALVLILISERFEALAGRVIKGGK